MAIGHAGQPVDIVVGVHRRSQTGPADRGFEREEERIDQLARTDMGRGVVQPAFRYSVADHVLGGGDHAFGRLAVPLQSANEGRAHHGREMRILAVRFLDAAPARVAGDVQDRRQRLMGADRSQFPAEAIGHRPHQLGIPCRGLTDRLRETDVVQGEQTVEAFLMDDRRDSQPGLLYQKSLDLVGQHRRLAAVDVVGALDPGYMPDSPADPLVHLGPIQHAVGEQFE